MSKNAMCELNKIFNDSESYGDRLAEFLKAQAAIKPQKNNSFVLGGIDFSFDVDVDLIKLPPKEQQLPQTDVFKPNITYNEQATQHNSQLAEPTIAKENGTPTRASSLPPRSSLRRSASDRLRIMTLKRRSRSCGSRKIPQESSNTSSNFLPDVNSTALSPLINQTVRTPAAEAQSVRRVLELDVADDALQQHDKLFSSFQNNMLSMEQCNQTFRLPKATVQSSLSESKSVHRTYTVERGPEPGQLLLSPKAANVTASQQLNSSLSTTLGAPQPGILRAPSLMKTPEAMSPKRAVSFCQTQTETQPQQLSNLIHNLSMNATGNSPFMVVPLACLSPKPGTPIQPTATNSSSKQEPQVANRSMQTSVTPRVVKDLSEIMTDDESDEAESSTVPLNLAPKTLKQRNRQSPKRTIYNLHTSSLKNIHNQQSQAAKHSVLNKPSMRPINGEDFAKELARMSNYEILDLRKCSSQGKLEAWNGKRRLSKSDKLTVKENIEFEILRRNLDSMSENSMCHVSSSTLLGPTAEFMQQSIYGSPHRTIQAAADGGDEQEMQSLGRRLSRRLNASALARSPLPPPHGFNNSSISERPSGSQHANVKRRTRSRSLCYVSPEGNESTAPIAPPSGFNNSSMQVQENSQRLRLRSLNGTALAGSPLPPPQGFNNSSVSGKLSDVKRRTRSKSLCNVPIDATLLTTPLAPPSGFNNSSMQVQENSQRLRLRSLNGTALAGSPLPPPQGFNNSSVSGKLSDVKRRTRSKSLCNVPIDATLLTTPLAPPSGFNNSSMQVQENSQRLRLRSLNGTALAGSPLPPPQGFNNSSVSGKLSDVKRRTRSKSLCNVPIDATLLTTPLAPPSGFNNSPIQQEKVHQQHQQTLGNIYNELANSFVCSSPLAPPNQFNDSTINNRQSVGPHEETPRRSRRSRSAEPAASSFNHRLSTVPPPIEFKDNSIQLQKRRTRFENPNDGYTASLSDYQARTDTGKARRSSMRLETVYESEQIENVEQLASAICTPPAQFRFSARFINAPEADIDAVNHEEIVEGTDEQVEQPLERIEEEPTDMPTPTEVQNQLPLNDTFKKPLHPAPRSNRLKELENTLTTPQSSDIESTLEHNTSEIRKSDRGQIPLCTSLLHSIEKPLAEIFNGDLKLRQHLIDPKESEEGKQSHKETAPKKRGRPKKVQLTKKTKEKKTNFKVMNSTKNKKDDKQKDNTALGTATKSLPQVPEGFPLMDWLNGGNEKMIQQGYNDEYYKDIQTDNVNISRANNLQFAMLDGVEYAFYKAESGLQMGYMRFKPLQIKGIQHTKIKLMFVVLHGMFEVRTKNKSKHIEEFKIKAGDYLEVKANCRYNIQNCSKNVALIYLFS
ncbi:uncharacterized protein LOC108603791 isoform X2 [Drosophila busckii]|uniref:uncharacterized protein LOC108603791 isoform X2 n=1 Tax=Drosophila busckii TaxID=30019 RepID=UPI00143293B4|nr:uncharacterized protein LOC108603791 isoform X2 [Drosophila busckii]